MGELDIYKDASPVEIRRRVGMVFQRPNPFPTMSIYDNVASGLKLNGFRKRKILDEVVERSLKQAVYDPVNNLVFGTDTEIMETHFDAPRGTGMVEFVFESVPLLDAIRSSSSSVSMFPCA